MKRSSFALGCLRSCERIVHRLKVCATGPGKLLMWHRHSACAEARFRFGTILSQLLLLSAFCFLPLAPAPAATQEQAPSAADKGRAILEAAIQALGGQAFLSARDVRAEGRAYQFGREQELSGMARFAEYEKFPDKVRQELGKDKDIIIVFNGEKGWDKDFHGVREYAADEMQRVLQNRVLSVEHILRYRLNEPGLTMRYVGGDIIASRPVDLVEVTDAENRVVTIAVEQASKLPVRREWSRRNPQTRVRENEMEVLGNYQKAGAILTPFYVRRERDGQKMFEVFLTSAAYNVNPADSLFDRPPGPERRDPHRRKR